MAFAVLPCCGWRRAVSRLPVTGAGLRRRALPARNVVRARMHLRGRGDRWAAHGAVEFGTALRRFMRRRAEKPFDVVVETRRLSGP